MSSLMPLPAYAAGENSSTGGGASSLNVGVVALDTSSASQTDDQSEDNLSAQAANDINSALKEGSTLTLSTTTPDLWSSVTEGERTYAQGAKGADAVSSSQISTEVTGSGWIIFDWAFTSASGGWNNYFDVYVGADSKKQIGAGSSTYRSWSTAVIPIERACTITWRWSNLNDDYSADIRLDNIRFVTAQTNVSATADENTTVTVKASSSEVTQVDPGTSVTFAATPNAGTVFKGWMAANDSTATPVSTSASYSVTVYDDPVALYAFSEEPFTGTGTEANPYQLSTLNDLIKLDGYVLAGNTFEGQYFKLMNDIDCNNSDQFDGIGSSSRSFGATLDGDGRAIDKPTLVNGLFASLAKDATINNLKVTNAAVTASDSHAGIVAASSSGKIDNCEVSGTISSTLSNKSTGAFVGSLGTSGQLISSTSSATVTSTGDTTGSTYGVGGLIGASSSGIIQNCSTTGNVSASAFSTVGGVLGLSSSATKVESCRVTANVTGKDNVGGIVGTAETNNDAYVKGCTYLGTVSGSSDVAGIVGHFDGNWNAGTVYTVENNVVGASGNLAAVTASSGKAAGIVGGVGSNTKDLTVSGNTAYLASVTATGATAKRIVSFDATTMERNFATQATTLNGEAVADADKGHDTQQGEDVEVGPEKVIGLATVAVIPDQEWTGNEIKPVITVTPYGQENALTETDFTVTYDDNTDAGVATATVEGTGTRSSGYFGSQVVKFNIVKSDVWAEVASNVVKAPSGVTIDSEVKGLWATGTDSDRTFAQGSEGATMTATFDGSGWIIFDWKVGPSNVSVTRECFDVAIDGAAPSGVFETGSASYDWFASGSVRPLKGTGDGLKWTTLSVPITGEGVHTVTWSFYDASTAWGGLDNVRFTSNQTPVTATGDAGVESIVLKAYKGQYSSQSIESGDSVNPGTVIDYTATPKEGYTLMGWKTEQSDTAAYVNTNANFKQRAFDEPVTMYAYTVKAFEGAGTEVNPYLIKTMEDLLALDTWVSAGNDYSGQFFELANDITDDGTSGFAGVGASASSVKSFKGTFDGKNHTISGVTMNPGYGLFKSLDSATVKNLALEFNMTLTNDKAGMLACNASSSTIEKVTVDGSLSVTKTGNNTGFGGVVGTASLSTFANCVCNADILTGSEGNTDPCLGGVVGSASSSTITGCVTTGDIDGQGVASCIGGIVGKTGGTSKIENCLVKSNINGNQEIGGIVGYSDGVSAESFVKNCEFNGTVSGKTSVGGIVGEISGWNTPLAVSGCLVTGTVEVANGGTGPAGGIAGKSSNSSNVNISNNAVLLESLTGATANRIIGTAGNAVLSDNYAWSGMTVNGSVIASDNENAVANKVHGASIGTQALLGDSVAACYTGWDNTAWTTAASKKPVNAADAKLSTDEYPEYIALPDMTEIDKAIAEANAELALENSAYVVSDDAAQVPNEMNYATNAQKTALSDAITAATTAKGTVETAEEVTAAAQALKEAIVTFQKAYAAQTGSATAGETVEDESNNTGVKAKTDSTVDFGVDTTSGDELVLEVTPRTEEQVASVIQGDTTFTNIAGDLTFIAAFEVNLKKVNGSTQAETSLNANVGHMTLTFPVSGIDDGTPVRVLQKHDKVGTVFSDADATYTYSSVVQDGKVSIILQGKLSQFIIMALDKSVLEDLIASATSNMNSTTVSATGSDVLTSAKYVTSDEKQALADAIAAAQDVLDNATTQDEIDNAITALQAAVTAFDAAKKSGTKAPAVTGKVMYRLYNPYSGEHLYTSDASERDNLRRVGWNYEGEAWTAPSKSNTPVYRLYNSYEPLGDHHYTTSKSEYDHLVSIGWTGEGVGWYSDDAKGVGLHRLYNPNAYGMGLSGAHHYTTSNAEKNNLVSLGWQYENYGWYGMK